MTKSKKYTLNRTPSSAKIRAGIFPGMNRSRKFVNRKKAANKKACRGAW